jgi:hypothetical protein
MGFKRFIAAFLLFVAATPAGAAEPWDPRHNVTSLMYFVRIPLDARAPREREPVFGLVMRGSREREFVVLDTRMLNLIDGGISAKFLIAGAVALGAAVAVGGSGGGSSEGAIPPAPPKPASSTTSTSTSSSGGTSGGAGGGTGSGAPAPCPQVCPNK